MTNSASIKERMSINWLDETDSTNNEVKRHLNCLNNLTVTAASFQNSGKGQRGNSWHSEKGKNLTFSLLLKFGGSDLPQIEVRDQFIISEIVALAMVKTLNEYGISPKIKWPNDIYVGDEKIAGILIENTISEGSLLSCIVGIGLNVNQVHFPDYLPNPTSMAKISGSFHKLEPIIVSIVDIIVNLYNQQDTVHREYLKHLYRLGEVHSFVDNIRNEEVRGEIVGVDYTGKLQLRLVSGEIREYWFKEVAYINL